MRFCFVCASDYFLHVKLEEAQDITTLESREKSKTVVSKLIFNFQVYVWLQLDNIVLVAD